MQIKIDIFHKTGILTGGTLSPKRSVPKFSINRTIYVYLTILSSQVCLLIREIPKTFDVKYSQTLLFRTRRDCLETVTKYLKIRWLWLTNRFYISIVFEISLFEISKCNCIIYIVVQQLIWHPPRVLNNDFILSIGELIL